MNRVSGIYQNGQIVLDQPVDWPEGMHVDVIGESGASEGADFCLDGSRWEDTPEASQRWIEWFDTQEPVFTGPELDRFEAGLRSAREAQEALLPKWRARLTDLVK